MKERGTKKVLIRRWQGRMGVALLFLLMLGVGTVTPYAAEGEAEYRIKAALMYKLTKFVHWPEVETRAGSANFSLCMVGRDPIAPALESIEGRKVMDRPLWVQNVAAVSELGDCDMAFVSRDGLVRFPGVLEVLARNSVLSISDQRGFASQGGMVELARKGRKLIFRVNRKNAAQGGVHFAAPFLEIAVLVGD